MRKLKAILSVLLAMLLAASVSAEAFAAIPASAPAPDAQTAVIRSEMKALKRLIPKEFHLTNIHTTDISGKNVYYIEGEGSEYGLVPFQWVDAAGREIPLENLPFITAAANVGAGETFPAAYDARDYGYITPVENQVGGTCWAHAAAACLEANAIRKGIGSAEDINISEYHLVWNGLNGYYEGVTDSANDGLTSNDLAYMLGRGGNFMYISYAALNHQGPAYESRYNLDESVNVAGMVEQMRSTFTYETKFDRDLSAVRIVSFPGNVQAIKAGVLEHGAIQISYCTSSQFYSFEWYWDGVTPCAYYCPEARTTNHAVTIVGWDDNFSRDYFTGQNKPTQNGAWLVKNSWGERWGNNGYFWISYEDATLGTPCSYEVEALTDRENVYTHNGFICASDIMGTAAANVFTARSREYLTYVTFGKTFNDYTLKVYVGLPDTPSSPTDGTLIYTQSGNAGGKNLIPITGNVDLQPGQRFSVVIEGIAYVSTEGAATSVNSGASLPATHNSAPGQSFVLQNGQWNDTSVMGKNNVDLDVFTRSVGGEPYTVNFVCPGYNMITAVAENGVVALPETEGHTWVCTYRDAPFTGTGVDRNMTVTAHCYPNAGTVSPTSGCVTEYNCIYCGKQMRAPDADHTYTDTAVPATREHAGYILHTCSVCGKKDITDWFIHPDGDGEVNGNFVWQYYDGALSFNGVGATPDFANQNVTQPWKPHAAEVTDLFINEGITHLGAFSFCYFNALKNISYPSTITSIGNSAFFRCGGLTDVIMPKTLTSIGTGTYDSVYTYCNGIRRLEIEEGAEAVPGIVYKSNEGNASLEVISIPASLKTLTAYSYYYYVTSLQRYEVSPDNAYFSEIDGVLFNKDATILISYPPSHPGNYYRAPASVQSFGTYAFTTGRTLEYLDLSDTACRILTGQTIAYGTKLKNVNLPAGLTNLNKNTFYSLPETIQKMYFPSSFVNCPTASFFLNFPLTIYSAAEYAGLRNLTDTHITYEVLEGHTHAFTETAFESPATCAAPGYAIKTCLCGQFEYTQTPSNGQHVKSNPVVHPATCTAPGYTEYTCSECGAVFTDDETPLAEHDWQWVPEVPATCGAAGVQHQECSVCHATQNWNTPIQPTGNHTWEWVPDVPATCSAPGVQHQECTVCHATQNGNTPIAPTGEHEYTARVVNETTLKVGPSCISKAEYYFSCAECGRVERDNDHTFTAGEMSEHTWEWVPDTPATCGTAGLQHQECSFCHATQNWNTPIQPIGNHTWEWVPDTPATCGAAGLQHQECSVCHATQNQNTPIQPTGNHTWEWVPDTPATCGAAGVQHQECSVCLATQNQNTPIQPTGNHTWEWVPDVPASCGTAGVQHQECTVCHATQNGNTPIAPTGDHKYTAKVINETTKKADASCISKAEYYFSCADCGRLERDDGHTFTVGEMSEHTWEWVPDTPATCGTAGLQHQECSFCHAKQNWNTPIQPKGNHTWEWVPDVPATCSTAGVQHKECSICHENTDLNTAIPATGNHTWKWVPDTPATCGAPGVQHKECSVCHEKTSLNTAIPATGDHRWNGGAVTSPATCTAQGVKTFTCTVCGATRTESIGKTAHTDADGNGYCDVCNTQLDSGLCKYCHLKHEGFFGKITQVFHNILYFINNLFH